MKESIRNSKIKILKKYKELVEYEKKSIFPEPNLITELYTLVYYQILNGDDEAEYLYNFHSYLTERCVDESFNCIKNVQESEFLDLFIKQINKINYILYFLNRTFIYLDRYYEKSKNFSPINAKSFEIFKNNFLIPCKDNLFKALINYLLYNNNNLENEEIYRKVKKIFNLMNLDENSKLNIIKINNEIIWKNEVSNLSENGNKIFDNWFNNYVLKEISLYYYKNSIEFKNLPIPELISSILKVKDHLNSLKIYFDEDYYKKISLIFDEYFIKNNKEKIENYLFNLDKNGFKQFYEIIKILKVV